jgi:LysR family nitrogen assimilation transcriptional regulator
MVPTDAGQRFFESCMRVESELQSALASVSAMNAPLIIGLTNAAMLLFGEELLRSARNAGLVDSIKIVERSSAELDHMLGSQTADICISYSGTEVPGAFKIAMFRENLQYVTATDQNLRQSVDFSEVLSRPIILQQKDDAVRRLVEEYAEAMHAEIVIAAEVSSIGLTRKVVAQGPHGTILSASSVLEDVMEGKLCMTAIVNPHIARTIFLSIRSRIRNAPTIVPVLSLIAAVAADQSANQLRHLEPLLPESDVLQSLLDAQEPETRG